MKISKIYKVFIFALVIRVMLLPFSFHSDLNNNAIWGIYAQEFGLRGFYDWLNFGNYARPDYPPFAIIMFLIIRHIWQFLFNMFWFINIKLPLFPSNFIPWFETKGFLMLIKIPGVLADIGIGFLLYRYLSKKYSSQKAGLAVKLFLFNPAIIYLSASWGQLDSIVGFFGLLAIILVLNKKYIRALSWFFVSTMLKVTMIMLSPFLIIEALVSKISFNKILLSSLIIVFYMSVVGYVFTDHQYIIWLTRTYWVKFVPGAVTLPYINLNAFNFWGLLLGLERLRDEQLFLGISLFRWAWVIFLAIFSKILYTYLKNKDIFWAIFMTYFAAFMFMPRVHERYLYPIFIFAPILIINKKLSLKVFYILSIIFLLNLYHWWWFPSINFIINVLESGFIERLLSLINTLIFILLFRNYVKKDRA